MSESEQAKQILQDIIEDNTVPKNIRVRIREALDIIQTEKDNDMVRDSVTQILDEVVSDPNLPLYTRTQIWSAVSLLESS